MLAYSLNDLIDFFFKLDTFLHKNYLVLFIKWLIHFLCTFMNHRPRLISINNQKRCKFSVSQLFPSGMLQFKTDESNNLCCSMRKKSNKRSVSVRLKTIHYKCFRECSCDGYRKTWPWLTYSTTAYHWGPKRRSDCYSKLHLQRRGLSLRDAFPHYYRSIILRVNLEKLCSESRSSRSLLDGIAKLNKVHIKIG